MNIANDLSTFRLEGNPQQLTVDEVFWIDKLKNYLAQAQELRLMAKEIGHTLDDEEMVATHLLQIKTSLKELDAIRLQSTLPLREWQKKLNDWFAFTRKPLDEARNHLEINSRAIVTAKREKANQERLLAERQHRDQLEAIKQTAHDSIQPQQAPPPIIEAPTTIPVDEQVKSPLATVHTITQKKVKIADASKLPREYLVPDHEKIKRDLFAGISIPGAALEYIETQRVTKTKRS